MDFSTVIVLKFLSLSASSVAVIHLLARWVGDAGASLALHGGLGVAAPGPVEETPGPGPVLRGVSSWCRDSDGVGAGSGPRIGDEPHPSGAGRSRSRALRILGAGWSLEDARCGVCAHRLKVRIVRCASCHAPHHRECFEYNGRCSTFGCAGTDHRPAPVRPRARALAN